MYIRLNIPCNPLQAQLPLKYFTKASHSRFPLSHNFIPYLPQHSPKHVLEMATAAISRRFNFCDRLSGTHWSQGTSWFAQHIPMLQLTNMGLIFVDQNLNSPCPVSRLEKQPAPNRQGKEQGKPHYERSSGCGLICSKNKGLKLQDSEAVINSEGFRFLPGLLLVLILHLVGINSTLLATYIASQVLYHQQLEAEVIWDEKDPEGKPVKCVDQGAQRSALAQ